MEDEDVSFSVNDNSQINNKANGVKSNLNTNFVDSYFVDMLTNNIGFLVLGCFFAIPHKKINKWTWPLIPVFILAIAYLVSGSFNPFLYFRF